MARCGCFFTCIMYLNTILLSIFLIVFCRVSYAHWESKEAIAKADWVDPHEMFPLKSKSSSEIALSDRLSKRQGPCTEKDCSYLLAPSVARAEVIMLRHVLRRFVSFTDLSVKKDATFDVSMRIDPDQFRAFEQLLETPLEDAQSTPVLDAWNQLTKTLRVSVEPTSVESVEKFIGFKLNLVFQIMLMFLLPVILIYLERHLRMSLYAVLLRTFKYALLTSVLISFPWTWFRIYQEKVAEQQRLLFEKSQAHCKEIGAGQILLRSVQNWFKIIPDSSPCSQYYRAINVHPFLDVPPTMAVAVTLTHFVVEPLSHVGLALGNFFKGTLAPLPFFMWPVVVFFILFVTFLLIIVKAGYRVHLPYFLARIEPGHPPPQAVALPPVSANRRDQLDYGYQESQREPRLEASTSRERERTPKLMGYPRVNRIRKPSYSLVKRTRVQRVRRNSHDDPVSED